jgi:phosphoesterase RecJ-like protein
MSSSPVDQICGVIESRSAFLLVTHFEPDGDGIGACLALWHALRARGKTATVWVPAGVPDKYAFLPGAQAVVREAAPQEVAIALDCDGTRRLGATADTVNAAAIVIDIDHHAGHSPFGQIAWLDDAMPAAGYQVYELLRALGSPLTPEIATCLYCAVGTDSGYFRYANTSPRLLRMAAELVEEGADPKAIAEATLDRHALQTVHLAGRALASLSLRLGGCVALAVLTAQDYVDAGAEHSEGVIDYLRTLAGVDLLVLIREAKEGWRVSMRSLGTVDVSRVARSLGGGGHPAAAGCTLHGSLEEAWAALEAALARALSDGDGG